MNKIRQTLSAVPLILLSPLALTAGAFAQDYGAPYEQQAALLGPDQLAPMVAPIALYPDPLVAQILMASAYPLEIVEAARWQQDPGNAGLQGDRLAQALTPQPWDPSVKSLVAFPQVLATLNENIEWTERLGDAFLAQQPDVMNAIQALRYQAVQAGTLGTTAQQRVLMQGTTVLIQPVNPNVVYVPYYNPRLVYGAWRYPEYQPYYFANAPVVSGPALSFAVGIGVIAPLWGWNHWDWRDHRITINNARYARINEGHPPEHPGVWAFNPDHRHGMPLTPGAVAQHGPEHERGFEPGHDEAHHDGHGEGGHNHASPAFVSAPAPAAVPAPVSHGDAGHYGEPRREAGPRPVAAPVTPAAVPVVRPVVNDAPHEMPHEMPHETHVQPQPQAMPQPQPQAMPVPVPAHRDMPQPVMHAAPNVEAPHGEMPHMEAPHSEAPRAMPQQQPQPPHEDHAHTAPAAEEHHEEHHDDGHEAHP